MKLTTDLLLGIILASAFAAIPVTATAGETRPNVIVIVTDDQGSVDAHCYGAQTWKHRRWTASRRSGVRFTQFYCGAPRSARRRGRDC